MAQPTGTTYDQSLLSLSSNSAFDYPWVSLGSGFFPSDAILQNSSLITLGDNGLINDISQHLGLLPQHEETNTLALLPTPSEDIQSIVVSLTTSSKPKKRYLSPTRPTRPRPNNRFGRKGIRRCEKCRSWRQKVPISLTPLTLVRIRSK